MNKQDSEIRALFVDLDGVIRIWVPTNDEQAEQSTGLPAGAIQRAAFASDLLTQAITGHINDEEWRNQVERRLQTQFPNVDAVRAVAAWSASPGEIDHQVLDVVRACRASVPVVLITNASSRLNQDLAHLGIANEFDHIVNSSTIGFAKPHPAVFQLALELVGVSPSQALFVDDTDSHVAAATQVGLQGHIYRDVSALREELVEYNLLRRGKATA